MIQLYKVKKEFGDKIIFNNADLIIYDGEKVGIIGDNGQGKSTLLEIIVGKITADSGQVVVNDKIGFLEQNTHLNVENLLEKMSDVEFVCEFFRQLSGLGFSLDFEFTQERVDSLSCGERAKIALASILADNPTTLILDEPTNHLDYNGKCILIDLLNNFNGTVIIVSHDIDFLNATVNRIVEVKNGELKEYCGNYDDYLSQKNNEKLNIEREYKKHKRKVAQIQEDITQYKNYASLADARRSKPKADKLGLKYNNGLSADIRQKKLSKVAANQITKLERELNKEVEKPERTHEIRYKLKVDDIHTRFAFVAESLTKKFNDKVLFENANFNIESGDKIALIGDNGVGKSTLVNILLGKTDYEGKLFVAPSVKPAIMQQDIYDLDFNITINEMSKTEDKEFCTNFILNLCTMNIDKSRFNTKIGKLSSGEKMRIKLSQLILSDANLLILDEPTNHLDILNKKYLEKVLAGFVGTLIVISHDREFLRNVTNKTLEIKDKKIIVSN